MKNKIKKFVTDNKYELTLVTTAAASTLAVYTTVCYLRGYSMVRPYQYDEDYFYVKTITGKILKSEKLTLDEK